jgi:hypothetical protein
MTEKPLLLQKKSSLGKEQSQFILKLISSNT